MEEIAAVTQLIIINMLDFCLAAGITKQDKADCIHSCYATLKYRNLFVCFFSLCVKIQRSLSCIWNVFLKSHPWKVKDIMQ